MSISFEGRVAIVTGAGVGLGRSHALGLAARATAAPGFSHGCARGATCSTRATARATTVVATTNKRQ